MKNAKDIGATTHENVMKVYEGYIKLVLGAEEFAVALKIWI